MAKFCTKCGRPLVEGQICPCQLADVNSNSGQQPVQAEMAKVQEQQPVQPEMANPQEQQPVQPGTANQQEQQPVQPGTANVQGQQPTLSENAGVIYLKHLFQTSKNLLCHPVDYGTAFAAESNYSTALGMFGLQAIASALFALVVMSKLNTLLSLVAAFTSSISTAQIKMPLVRIFFVTVIGSFALSCALAGILLGICFLFKVKTTYKTMMCVTAMRSILSVLVTVVSIVLFFLNASVGIMCFYLGNVAGLLYMMTMLLGIFQNSKNKMPIILFITVVIFALVSLFIMYRCIPLYVPDTVKTAWSSLKDIMKDPSQLLGGNSMGYFY